MTDARKSMMTFSCWRTMGLLLVLGLLFMSVQTQGAYAERKKVSGTSENIVVLAMTPIPIASSPTKGRLTVYHSMLSSADPDWNDARFFYVEYDEPTQEWDERGYGAITHAGGHQTFVRFESKWTTTTGYELAGERKGVFIGGTGKFEGIRASWLSKWKYNKVTGHRMAEWVVEYIGD